MGNGFQQVWVESDSLVASGMPVSLMCEGDFQACPSKNILLIIHDYISNKTVES